MNFQFLTEEIIIDLVTTYFISIFTYYMNFRIINKKEKNKDEKNISCIV